VTDLVPKRPYDKTGDKVPTFLLALVVLDVTILPARPLGTEFMPALNEGALLYVPKSLPELSVAKATQSLQTQDLIIKSFPELKSACGKAGRASTAPDAAPLEMFETIIDLKPKDQCGPGVTLEPLPSRICTLTS
jgi:copper/silver efflux system protein